MNLSQVDGNRRCLFLENITIIKKKKCLYELARSRCLYLYVYIYVSARAYIYLHGSIVEPRCRWRVSFCRCPWQVLSVSDTMITCQ